MTFPALANHIVFVSRQNQPTLIAAAMGAPTCIHAIVSEKMKRESQTLRLAIEARNMRYREYSLPSMEQAAIERRLDQIYNSCGKSCLGVNVTGGTKLMALASAEWAESCNIPAFYVDTENERIVLLRRPWQYYPIPDLLDISSLLAAYGYVLTNCRQLPTPVERRDVFKEIITIVCGSDRGATALRHLNNCANKGCVGEIINPRAIANDDFSPTPEWNKLIASCQRAGMLRTASGHLRFPSEDAKRWCNGSWLEEYVGTILYKLRASKYIRSWASAAHVSSKSGVSNELDGIFSKGNRIFIIECKTIKIGGNTSITEVLYKANSLQEKLGGDFGGYMFCSVNCPSSLVNQRAADWRIKVVSGLQLLNLEDIIRNWSNVK